ncbi:serine/threonine protein kinase [Friedmanniomyces endolithicus]|nr:serine/threonine protein kinase [Friedmanniomyces endolithicus]KAK0879709.1 serine/threonine protein kinase [Friedmanniomyces endolithicus]
MRTADASRRSPEGASPERATSKPAALQIPKIRSTSNLLAVGSGNNTPRTDALSPPATRTRNSVDAGTGTGTEAYDSLSRSPIFTHERDNGLHRIRQPPPSRGPSSPNLHPSRSPSLQPLDDTSRRVSLTNINSGPSSPTLHFGEDLARFPTESLHSFSFAHQSSDSLHNRQNVLKRSIEFMRDKVGWAATSPRIASAQARLAGDEELLSMMELMQKAHLGGTDAVSSGGLTLDKGMGLGLDLGLGPLTGPAHHMASENVFERSFMPGLEEQSESPTRLDSPDTIKGEETVIHDAPDVTTSSTEPQAELRLAPTPSVSSPSDQLNLSRMTTQDDIPGLTPKGSSLKRTYTDVSGYSLQYRLTEAMAKPYRMHKLDSSPAPVHAPNVPRAPPRSATLGERAPHGHRSAQSQAIFTTEAQTPWTITAANDLACLVFGVTRAEVRKLGIMEVIKPERRKWLEDKLRNSTGPPQRPKASPSQQSSPNGSVSGMRNGVTAKLLAKPPARDTYQSRRSKTENGVRIPSNGGGLDHKINTSKSRGVLLCGDVVPIQKMNGATGSASLWVKEKGGNLIWVLEEIAEDVAFITVDEIGSVIRGRGDVEAIWGLERLRGGMDVQKLIPGFPKLPGTNTGALDYDAVAQLRRFTARTANSISIPITIDQLSGESSFRVSSFPHIAGIMVLHPQTMRISSSNSVFSAALFGYSSPDGMLITELIPGFDKLLHIMTDEDKIALVDGIVIPEHSFRRARSLLAKRQGSAEGAALFLRPSGLPAKHRDGAEIMIDVQMRVVQSDREPIYTEHTIVEDDAAVDGYTGSEVVFALWITYSRQLHAVNHGVGPVTALVSRPGTPPDQPAPGQNGRRYLNEAMPSPMVLSETGDEDMRVSMLTEQLEEAKALQEISAEDGTPTDNEPFEHPSPDMVEAGCKTIGKKRIDDFVILEEMGQGAYGQVKLARYKKAAANKMVIKYVTKRRILVDTWHRDRRLGTVPLEIHVLDYLRREGMQHPNIVEMADFFEDDVNYYIEMVPHGLPGMDLFDFIELRVTMGEKECRKIFRQVAEAIRHLHVTAKVVHRDIKDENVILDGEGRVRLVDFGSAAYIKSGPFDVFVGTIDYAAPEVLRGQAYRGKEQDIWAMGILLYTLVYKENPFYSIDEIMDHDLRVPYVMSEACIDLIRKLLDRDVERRIGIQGVLEHVWFTMPDDEEDEEEEVVEKVEV